MRIKKALFIFFAALFALSGCTKNVKQVQKSQNESTQKQKISAESKRISKLYHHIYEKGNQEKTLNTIGVKREIADCIGKEGYAVIDTENRIDMVNAKQIEEFCIAAKTGNKAEATILLLMDDGGFLRYDLEAEDGNMKVNTSSLRWEKQEAEVDCFEEYEAYTWAYTEKGYLFIEQYHMSGYDGPPGQIGIRVKPVDPICRELNQEYVLPIGYERNKLLITEWNEHDFSQLDFYDLYEIMYPMKYGSYVPYDHEYGGTEYEIPKAEFEEVIKTYFQIDSSVLESMAVYHSDSETYRYRPRGQYDAEFPYEPYSEVTAYENREDGTIELTVEAVWIREKLERAMSSELIVRPLADGGVQYVSNHLVSFAEGSKAKWYCERLTDEEWNKYYPNIDSN